MTDEAAYLFQVYSLQNSFIFDNGYPELKHESTFIIPWWADSSEIYVSYPAGYALFGYPFFTIFGMDGLFILTILSFAAILLLIRDISFKLGLSEFWSLIALFSFSVCTFAPQYATALWPHMLSTALVLFGFYLVLEKKFDLYSGALSVIALSLATTIRYTNGLFFIPLVVLLFIRDKKYSVSLLCGIPFFGFLAITNKMRFGSFFSSGYPFYKIQPEFGFFGVYSYGLQSVYIHLCLAYKYLVDSQSFKQIPGIVVQATQYGDGFTKSLLQSSPFLSLAPIGALVLWISGKKREMLILSIIVILNVGYYTARPHHGGPIHNTRYLLESIPALILLFTVGFSSVCQPLGDRFSGLINSNKNKLFYWLPLGVFVFLILFATFFSGAFSDTYVTFRAKENTILSSLTFLIAAISLASPLFLLSNFIPKLASIKIFVTVLLVLLVVSSLFFSFMINYIFEYRFYELQVRNAAVNLANKASNIVEDHSVLISYGPSAFRMSPIKLNKDVWIFAAHADSSKSVLDIVDYGLQTNRTPYLEIMGAHPSWVAFYENSVSTYFTSEIFDSGNSEKFIQITGNSPNSFLSCGSNCSSVRITFNGSEQLFSPSGFYPVEKFGNDSTARWTNGSGCFIIPGKWQVSRIRINATQRSPKAVADTMEISFGGKIIGNHTLSDSFEIAEFDVEPYRVRSINQICINSTTWVPAEYSLSNDNRILGVVVRSIELDYSVSP